MPVPGFVAALRSHVGHDLLWLPGVSAVVLDDDGRLLLGRRADNGLWAVVSGILEPGEDPAVGLAREVLEETGVDVVVDALVAVTVTSPVEYPNGDRSQYLDLCFLCRAASPESAARAHVADDESTDVAWFAPDDVPPDLAPSSAERVGHALGWLAAGSGSPFFVR
ncbi:NUDIX hydrolase [Krasilnikoviella flava]|uniref:ADP-ribose pyrophosphatase YjhB, NUDIX family n=1 Tax=Krasilnikoviella flava TaxID=526729 RepID=A0A1T5INS7_9MICO|nr:NUDIX domain-containing protein [Krasilnikoviella flava]SKC40712.1 ADP-ribose pyrophosphatase YjhB, NUDIX family [Krasilnikoviella flava]